VSFGSTNCADSDEKDWDWVETGSIALVSDDLAPVVSIKNAVEAAINTLPGVNVDVSCVAGTATTYEKDCCENGFRTNSLHRAQGSLTVSCSAESIPIWGPPSIDKEFDFGVAVIDVTFQCNVSIDVGFSATGYCGKQWSTGGCSDVNCVYAGFEADISLGASVTCEAIACVDTIWTSEHCVGISIVPASITATVKGNCEFGCGASGGSLTLGSVIFSASFTCAGVQVKYDYDILKGVEI
jgi:hypothetical protein